MSETKYPERKLRVEKYRGSDAQNEYHIYVVCSAGDFYIGQIDVKGFERNEELANRLVHRFNCHKALLAACKGIINEGGTLEPLSDAKMACLSAIADAEPTKCMCGAIGEHDCLGGVMTPKGESDE